MNSQNAGVELYVSLGKLFYSVAMADGRVHPKELAKMNDIVKESWLDVDDLMDSFHSDAAHQIETVFDWAMDSELTSEQAFEEFEAFYTQNHSLFSNKIKGLIVDTSLAIANAFARKNKAELLLLGRIKLLLME